ncbi:hypothetical protein GOBAR_AA35734 [Gossypium barbadense]|uniref:SHSP domain-containing protein n=1 Tax=Gossypium barbadense TaxID=3634 RepID=A0A2P5W1K0_GOSBA|nr:hypothetical protein GOBAR_AA35734 [Gossypium barbadense]
MRIHPLPKKRNITIQYEMNPRTTRSQAETLLTGGSNKKLRRLPHIFSRVLELPFRSDADVAVEESPDCFKFVAETDGMIGDVVRAHTVEIHPGVTKIVIRTNSLVDFGLLDDLELDMWRFRLPETTRPELASAVYEDGELIVTVPKGGEVENLEDGGGGDEGENLYELVEIRQMGKLGKASLRCEPCGSGVASLIGFLCDHSGISLWGSGHACRVTLESPNF